MHQVRFQWTCRSLRWGLTRHRRLGMRYIIFRTRWRTNPDFRYNLRATTENKQTRHIMSSTKVGFVLRQGSRISRRTTPAVLAPVAVLLHGSALRRETLSRGPNTPLGSVMVEGGVPWQQLWLAIARATAQGARSLHGDEESSYGHKARNKMD